jgi:hypothetical protein
LKDMLKKVNEMKDGNASIHKTELFFGLLKVAFITSF